MITWNFFRELGLPCIPFLERLEGRLVVQAFVRDVVIIEVVMNFLLNLFLPRLKGLRDHYMLSTTNFSRRP